MTGLVVCCQCGKDHRPYAMKEECFDSDNPMAIEDAKLYPSAINDDEIYINYPWCRDCYLEEVGDPPEWDEEWLSQSSDETQDVPK